MAETNSENGDAPEAVLGLTGAFALCRVLLTAVELDAFSHISSGATSVRVLADRTGSDLRALTLLLDCLVAHGYLQKTEARYQLTEGSSALAGSSPHSVLSWVRNDARQWHRWSRLGDHMRGNRSGGDVSRPGRGGSGFDASFVYDSYVPTFNLGCRIAELPLFRDHQLLLDLGCGAGGISAAILLKHRHMSATLVDRQEVLSVAKRRWAEEGLSCRLSCRCGDLRRERLPLGHDLVLLSSIVHEFGADVNRELLSNIFDAMARHGRLLIRDFVMNDDHTSPASAALFAINMLVNTSEGRCYSFHDIEDMLSSVGFVDVELLQRGEGNDSLVSARKPH